MSLRHLFSGATTLGHDPPAGDRQPSPGSTSCRCPSRARSSNLTAYAITNDAAKAVEHGREAVTVARRCGVVRWASIANLNLAFAFLVRGEWDELEELLGSPEIPWERGIDVLAAAPSTRFSPRHEGTSRRGMRPTPPRPRGSRAPTAPG